MDDLSDRRRAIRPLLSPTDVADALVSYYALLIIHEADRQGKNSYGLDIYPVLESVKEDIRNYPHLHFHSDYIYRLNQIQAFYRERR